MATSQGFFIINNVVRKINYCLDYPSSAIFLI